MKTLLYKTKGTCSKSIEVEVENDVVEKVRFEGGCDGNTKGVASLVKGMKVEEVIKRLKGIDCKGKGTSCPDQLSKALEQIQNIHRVR
ncbi:MAG: TIGR03905 family TSCPD domain-containing protein [Bacteroidota bacterium]|nr:TIGR03905 family TSCPD domain-containing protein [Bacteroidota bacterium]